MITRHMPGYTGPRDHDLCDLYSPADRARDTRDFLGMSGLNYYDVSCRILTLAENACIVADSGGKHRIVKWQDLSFASETIARQNLGGCVVLKIRRWS